MDIELPGLVCSRRAPLGRQKRPWRAEVCVQGLRDPGARRTAVTTAPPSLPPTPPAFPRVLPTSFAPFDSPQPSLPNSSPNPPSQAARREGVRRPADPCAARASTTPLLSEFNKFFHPQACPFSAPPAPTPLLASFPPLPSRYTEQTGWDKKYLIGGLGAQQCPRRRIMQPHVQWALGPPLG